jgi:RHS repeat-associated protein
MCLRQGLRGHLSRVARRTRNAQNCTSAKIFPTCLKSPRRTSPSLVNPVRSHATTSSTPEHTINRYYDPSTDQFLSVDPLVDQTGQPYVFVNDDPLNAEDPLGLFCLWSCVKHGLASGADAVVRAASKTVASFIPKGTGMAMGACVGVGGGGGAGAKVSVCAGKTANGKAFSSLTVGGGTSTGGASVGVSLMFANAQSASQLGKKFTYVGGSAGAGPSVSIELEHGTARNKNIWVVSSGIGFGEPGAEYHQGVSWTWAKAYK